MSRKVICLKRGEVLLVLFWGRRVDVAEIGSGSNLDAHCSNWLVVHELVNQLVASGRRIDLCE